MGLVARGGQNIRQKKIDILNLSRTRSELVLNYRGDRNIKEKALSDQCKCGLQKMFGHIGPIQKNQFLSESAVPKVTKEQFKDLVQK